MDRQIDLSKILLSYHYYMGCGSARCFTTEKDLVKYCQNSYWQRLPPSRRPSSKNYVDVKKAMENDLIVIELSFLASSPACLSHISIGSIWEKT